MHKPKYTLTDKAHLLKAQIVKRAKNPSLYIHATQQMYHNICIRNTHSTLAIENNLLTQVQISDIIDGKHAELVLNEIIAVKNAYEAYSLFFNRHFATANPYSIPEMLNAHKTFMKGLVKEAGLFRSEPSAKHIPRYMDNLVDWAKMSNEHPLIKSCVFHYEIITQQPFAYGNGLIARKWQTMILLQMNDAPLRIPLMNVVRERRQEYYDIINISDRVNGCTKFIEYMLRAIRDALAEFEKDPFR